jgi:SAM-dependent methyltransferase
MTSEANGERFGFGANWARFLRVLDEDRIQEAERSLREMLGLEGFTGRTFLDVGSGSGLFSLAAIRLGAATVHSFDYDPASVACTLELKRRYFPDHEQWRIEQASVLDGAYIDSLGRFDIVYAWGVLHHTGNLQLALANVARPVARGGHLFIAIYNDQGLYSRLWARVKRGYNAIPAPLRAPYVALVMAPFEARAAAGRLAAGHPREYIDRFRTYKKSRGMSRWRDAVDWVGGYPFEVAKPGEIFDFYRIRGFELAQMRTTCGWGNNEYVFMREDEDGGI